MHGLSSYIRCLKIARISVLRNKLFANIPQYVIASCTHMTNISLPLKPHFHIHYFASHMSAWLSICLGSCPFFSPSPSDLGLSPLLSLANPLNALTCSEFRFSRAFSSPLPRVCKVEPFFLSFFLPLASPSSIQHRSDAHQWFWWRNGGAPVLPAQMILHQFLMDLKGDVFTRQNKRFAPVMNAFPLFVCMCRCCACLQSFPHHECGSAVSGWALRGCQWVLPKPTQRHPQRRNLLRLSRLVITASVSACPCVSSFLLGI